jgi:predicted DNA-binding transcriptional regulator AlpA
MSDENLLSTEDVSKMTGIPAGTLRYYRHSDQGPANFMLGGRRVVYRRADVQAWIDEQEQATRRGGGLIGAKKRAEKVTA